MSLVNRLTKTGKKNTCDYDAARNLSQQLRGKVRTTQPSTPIDPMLTTICLAAGSTQLSSSTLRLIIPILGVGIFLIRARTGVLLPRHLRLRRKGLDLLLAGRPVDAEKCYREALALTGAFGQSYRVRLLVCLSDALFDQRRYQEEMEYLTNALEIGDPTGSGQASMCDLLIAMKKDPERALQLADEASRLISTSRQSAVFGNNWKIAKSNLYDAKTWARKARALLLLDRRAEARQAIDRAMTILDSSQEIVAHAKPETSPTGMLVLGGRLDKMKELAIVNAHWEVGLALSELGDMDNAAKEFKLVQSTDRRGKYTQLATQKLLDLVYVTV